MSGSGQNLSLGPYEADFTYEADQGRILGNSIGASLFSGAFDQDLGMFGQINEREMIDPSKMVMTTYFGENAEGGSTKISIGDPSNDVESDSEDDDAPRIPPWEKQNSEPTPSSAASSGDLLLQAAQVQASEPEPEPVLGCTDSDAMNYDSNATQDDGSCEYMETIPCNGLVILCHRSYDDVTFPETHNSYSTHEDNIYYLSLIHI